MATSDLYELQETYPLEVPAAQVFNPITKHYDPVGEPLHYEFHAAQRQTRDSTDEPGVDRRTMTLTCQIVRSPDGLPLRLPLSTGATLQLTFRGKAGEAEVLPTPDTNLSEVIDEIGEEFMLLWVAHG